MQDAHNSLGYGVRKMPIIKIKAIFLVTGLVLCVFAGYGVALMVYRSRVSELTSNIFEKDAQISYLQSSLNEALLKIATLNSTLQDLQAQLSSTQTELDEALAKITSLETQLEKAYVNQTYVIFKDDSTIYARNGITGVIDWSSTDASAVINACIGNLTNGGKIFIKAGNYSLTTPITVEDNILIEGEGESTLLHLGSGADSHVFFASQKNNITIRDLKVDGNKDGQTDGHGGIYLTECKNTLIERVTVVNPRIFGIAFFGSTTENASINNIVAYSLVKDAGWNGICFNAGDRYGLVIACYVTGSSDAGISVFSLSFLEPVIGTKIVGCTSESNWGNCGAVNSHVGYEVERGNDIEIVSCNAFDNSVGVWVGDSNGTQILGGIYKDNGNAILPNDYTTIKSAYLANSNNATNPANIFAYQNKEVTIKDCIIEQTDLTTTAYNIYLHECQKYVIDGNIIKNSYNASAIYLMNAIDCIISNNHIYDDRLTVEMTFGIHVFGSNTNRTTIYENVIENTTTTAIYIQNGDFTDIMNNRIMNTGYGVSLESSLSSTILGNTISDTAYYDLVLSNNADRTYIAINHVDEIYLDHSTSTCDYNRIFGNYVTDLSQDGSGTENSVEYNYPDNTL